MLYILVKVVHMYIIFNFVRGIRKYDGYDPNIVLNNKMLME